MTDRAAWLEKIHGVINIGCQQNVCVNQKFLEFDGTEATWSNQISSFNTKSENAIRISSPNTFCNNDGAIEE